MPVLNGYNPVNNPVVDSKVASAILVACEKYTPLLTNLSISGIRVFWEKIFLWLKESTRISKMLGSLVGFSKVFHSCHFLINQSYYIDTLWLYLFTIMLVTDLLRFRSYNLSVKFLLSDFQINLC